MSSPEQTDITGMLASWSKGNEAALGNVVPLIYGDLRLIARRHLRQLATPVIQSTSLAHEAYLKLVNTRGIRCNNRAHFFALCSQMIRRILVDQARRRGSAKRGGSLQVPLDEALCGSSARGVEIEALDEALKSFARIDARKSRVVELRFFGGLSIEETADVLGVSEETVTRDWRMAKAWLSRELTRNAVSGQAASRSPGT